MAESLPKEQLLLKLLKMTSSSNDGEALTAMRKANELLASAGWDWDRLFAGKITVVGDPFAGLATPKPKGADAHAWQATTPAPPKAARPATGSAASDAAWRAAAARPSTPPQPPPPPKPRQPFSTSVNRYGNHCYCCGNFAAGGDGFIFNPHQHNPRAPDKSVVVCNSCNKNNYIFVPNSPARRIKQAPIVGPNPSLYQL